MIAVWRYKGCLTFRMATVICRIAHSECSKWKLNIYHRFRFEVTLTILVTVLMRMSPACDTTQIRYNRASLSVLILSEREAQRAPDSDCRVRWIC